MRKKKTPELAAKEQADMDLANYHDTSEADEEESIDDFNLEAALAEKKRLAEEQEKRRFESRREERRSDILKKYRYSKKGRKNRNKRLDIISEEDEDNFDENRVEPINNKRLSIQEIVRKRFKEEGLSYEDFDETVKYISRTVRRRNEEEDED